MFTHTNRSLFYAIRIHLIESNFLLFYSILLMILNIYHLLLVNSHYSETHIRILTSFITSIVRIFTAASITT